ncbi:hypothetical protein HMPREF9999_01682 [Alloprevotella sp. oral taxon 473 str. F0040]|nr:hypothetical protein HMPREF9999_01682 [Alloprevotella sp. oral taxon 473 str. F0040]
MAKHLSDNLLWSGKNFVIYKFLSEILEKFSEKFGSISDFLD